MNFDIFGIKRNVHERWCRFIIHRYLGHLLDAKLSLDQLSIDLGKGSIQIADLKLNSSYVNEMLECLSVPVRLVEGHIGSINLKVPWMNLTSDATEAEVEQMQLTFQALDRFHVEDPDFVSGMLGSVVDSLVSSVELAREFCDKEHLDKEEFGEGTDGVEAFSKVIDAVVARFYVRFTDTTVRVERPPEQGAAYATALEMAIQEFVFMDEQMKNVRQESLSTATIKSEPQRSFAVAKLHKYMTFKGLSFFTDIFSPVGIEAGEDAFSSQFVTSMHMRREMRKQREDDSLGPLEATTSIYTDFQSCYSTLPHGRMRPSLSPPTGSSKPLASNPVKFAEFAEDASVTIQINNTDLMANNSQDRKVDIDVSCKSFNVFLVPSQLVILQKFFTNISIQPTKPKERDTGTEISDDQYETVVQQQLENQVADGDLMRAGFGGGTETFHAFTAVSLDDNTRHNGDGSQFNSLNFVLENTNSLRKEGSTSFTAKFNSVHICLTHDDHLDAGVADIEEATKKHLVDSNRFFDVARSFEFHLNMPTSAIREACDKAYDMDHLRFTASTATVRLENTVAAERVSFKFVTCEVVESLQSKSGGREYCPLIAFKQDDLEDRASPNMRVEVTRVPGEQQSKIKLWLGRLTSELDISIIDRIAHSIAPRPFYLESKLGGTFSNNRQSNPSRLSENLFGTEQEEKKTPFIVFVECKEWTIDLRFPVVNLSSERHDYRQRSLHPEVLRLCFDDVETKVPISDGDDFRLDLRAARLTGYFIGDTEVLKCRPDDFCFLFGEKKFCDETEFVKFSFVYDPTTSTLGASRLSTDHRPGDLEKSFSAAVMKSVQKREGPFSQTHQSYTRDESSWLEADDEDQASESNEDMCSIVRAGTRSEMLSWADQCSSISDANLDVHIPNLRMHIVNHDFLEILYNRLVNDLSLWVPSAPCLLKGESTMSKETFKECKNDVEAAESDSTGEAETIPEVDMLDRSKNHLLSLRFYSQKSVILLGTTVTENEKPSGTAQICVEMEAPYIYVLYGYHADPLQTYFFFTTTRTTLAHCATNTIPCNVVQPNFGRFARSSDVVLERASDAQLVELSDEDSLAVAMHLQVRPNRSDVKDIMLAISVRHLQLSFRPFRDAGHLWATQIAALFTLLDYDIVGYELPKVRTELHINLEQIVVAYDHSSVIPSSPMKLRFVLGQSDICCGSLEADCMCELLCVFEKTKVFLSNQETKKSATFADSAPGNKKRSYVPIVDVGLFQLEVRLAQIAGNLQSTIPQTEIRCTNDLIKVWMCTDSLASLLNMASEIANSDAFSPIPVLDDIQEEGVPFDETRSEAGESTWSRPGTLNRNKAPPLAVDKEQQLRKMMESAIQDVNEPCSSGMGIPVAKDALEELCADLSDVKKPTKFHTSDFSDDENYHTRNTSLSTDEEFCMVDDIAGAGIVGACGEPRIKVLRQNFSPEDTGISPDRAHFGLITDTKTDGLSALPADYPQPLCRYLIKDLSVALHIFGGNDLGDEPDELKPYSVEEYCMGTGKGQSIPVEERGGPHRDHSVSIVLNLSKINVLHQIFDPSAPLMRMTLASIHDVTIKDRLKSSEINEMMYQYFTSENPRRTLAPMLAVRIVESHKCEGKLRISLLPVRLNIDQYTLDFIEDFASRFTSLLQLPKNVNLPVNVRPVIEVPAQVALKAAAEQRLYPELNSLPLTPSPIAPSPYDDLSVLENKASSPVKRPLNIDPFTDSMAFCRENTPHDELTSFQLKPLSDVLPEPSSSGRGGSVGFFAGSTDDLQGDWASSSYCAANAVAHEQLVDVPSSRPQPTKSVDELLMRSTMEGSIHPQAAFCDDVDEDTECDDNATMEGSVAIEQPMLTTYYKEFVFAPSTAIYIDYQGKQINLEKDGAVVGLLKGLGKLNRTEIVLKEIVCKNGLLGVDRCIQHAIDEWMDDIISNFPNVLASCGPISPLVQIGRGMYDLVWMPVHEMRKEDGHLVKGLQKGAGSFGVSTAAAVVELAQALVGTVQYAAETVFNEVNPRDAYLNNRNRRPAGTRAVVPADLRHATQLAYDIVRDGVKQTKDDLDLASQENRASGQSAIRSWLRFATPAVLRPMVMSAQVTYHMLSGLKNQLRPDIYQEDRHKWKAGDDDM